MSGDKPEVLWLNGQVVMWQEATVHVTSETAARGVNVFEGLRGYWRQDDNGHAIIALDAHLDRLRASARMMYLPTDHLPDLQSGVEDLVTALGHRGNLYIRVVVFLEEGRYTAATEDMRVGSYIVAYPIDDAPQRPVSCVVSSWRRSPDTVSPVGAKVGACYAALRLARIEAAARGADEPILLNERGTVAETAGAAVFVVRHGEVVTPPVSDGLLDSITRRIVIRLLREQFGHRVIEQSLIRSDLLSADEVFLTGTLDEIRPVSAVDGRALPAAPGPVAAALQSGYGDMWKGVAKPLDDAWVHVLRREADRAGAP